MVQLSNQTAGTPSSNSFVLWQAEDLSDALIKQTADLRFDWRNELPVLVINEAHKLSESSSRLLQGMPVVLIELSDNGKVNLNPKVTELQSKNTLSLKAKNDLLQNNVISVCDTEFAFIHRKTSLILYSSVDKLSLIHI